MNDTYCRIQSINTSACRAQCVCVYICYTLLKFIYFVAFSEYMNLNAQILRGLGKSRISHFACSLMIVIIYMYVHMT